MVLACWRYVFAKSTSPFGRKFVGWVPATYRSSVKPRTSTKFLFQLQYSVASRFQQLRVVNTVIVLRARELIGQIQFAIGFRHAAFIGPAISPSIYNSRFVSSMSDLFSGVRSARKVQFL